MRNLFLILLLMLLIGVGCNTTISNKDAKDKLQALLHVSISDSIEITDYQTSTAIGGDYTEIFVVHFKEREFDKIFNKVKPGKFNNIDVDIYGYTFQQKGETISAIFDPKEHTIKYTYDYE